jgi:hypothetical protein
VPEQSPVLVFDTCPDGHRANYVKIISRLFDAESLIAPVRPSLSRLLAARYLFLPTFESAPLPFFLLAVTRAVFNRPTATIMIRGHIAHPGRPVWNFMRQAVRRIMQYFSAIRIFRIAPAGPGTLARTGGVAIEDPEFWDLPRAVVENPGTTDLSCRVVQAAAGRTVLMVLGTLDMMKGLAFLEEILGHPDWQDAGSLCIVCAGPLSPDVAEKCPVLVAKSVVFEARYLTDAEIFSLYPVSDILWCCYSPDYDMSSGIFGRALQFDRPTVVRAGSLLEKMQRQSGRGVALAYGDAGMAIRSLATADWTNDSRTGNASSGSDILVQAVKQHAAQNGVALQAGA